MKLLFDQNLSYRLVESLADLFPESAHVRDVGLASARDLEIWGFAAANGFIIVSKDDDFRQMSILRGAPPKVIWLQAGNSPTRDIETLLRARASRIQAFESDADASFLIVTPAAV